MPNPACVAYETYREHWNKLATNNTYMIGWEYLTKDEKDVWWKVVRAIVEIRSPPLQPTGEMEENVF